MTHETRVRLVADGVVASYIHELSTRTARNGDRTPAETAPERPARSEARRIARRRQHARRPAWKVPLATA